MKLQCEMSNDCKAIVTHIGNKGYIYCTNHAQQRTGWESTRRMRVWESKLIESGERIPSYEYQGKPRLDRLT